MKLLKLSEEHYIVADNLDIKVGDWITDKYSVWQWKDDCSLLGRLKVTHSTQPIEDVGLNTSMGWQLGFYKIEPLSLEEVKELLGVVDVEKLFNKYEKGYYSFPENKKIALEHFKAGYKQSLEDNKEKKYTEEDMVEWTMCMIAQYVQGNTNIWDRDMLRKSLPQPKTEWDVEIIDGKLKLKS